MKTKLLNALSINFFAAELQMNHGVMLSVIKIGTEQAKQELLQGFDSFVGHADLANILFQILGIQIPVHRGQYEFQPGDLMIIAQYTGPRLPEGATQLPDGAEIQFFRVVCLCGLKTLA